MQLDGRYDTVSYIRLYAGMTNKTTSSSSLSVWLSPTPAFNVSGTLCATGLSIPAQGSGAVICPPASGTEYVTVVRSVLNRSESLVVYELQVFTTSESLVLGRCSNRAVPAPCTFYLLTLAQGSSRAFPEPDELPPPEQCLCACAPDMQHALLVLSRCRQVRPAVPSGVGRVLWRQYIHT